MRIIRDYFMINQQLVKNMHPWPRIGKTMQQLEGLQCAILLNINMGYYTISISPTSQVMTTIVNEFFKFRYNLPLMVMCTLVYIFQSKLDKILSYVEVLKQICMIHRY